MPTRKICLVFPRVKYVSGDPPMGIGYLASYVRAKTDAEVSIVDTTFKNSLESARKRIGEIGPDIVGIFSDSLMTKDVISIASWARGSGYYTVIGGPQATVTPEIFIPYADVVVRGEGEVILAEILKSFGADDLSHIPGIWWKKRFDVVRNKPTETFIALDELPFPRRDLFEMEKYIYYWSYLDAVDIKKRGTTMIVSRGCPFSCTYCQPTLKELFGKAVRFRSPENVVEEIQMLHDRYRIQALFFHDDTFTIDRAWTSRFCELLTKTRPDILWGCNSRVDTVSRDMLKMMYDAGLRVIHFGIESGSQRILDDIYRKKITIAQARETVELSRAIGIHTMGFFMLGAPTETEDEMNATTALARDSKLDEASFSLTTPFTGTYLYEMLPPDDRNRLRPDLAEVDYYSSYASHGVLGSKKIKQLQLKAYLLFYIHPRRLGYLMKHLLSIRGLLKLFNKLRRTLRCA